jgi:hypothetical protein
MLVCQSGAERSSCPCHTAGGSGDPHNAAFDCANEQLRMLILALTILQSCKGALLHYMASATARLLKRRNDSLLAGPVLCCDNMNNMRNDVLSRCLLPAWPTWHVRR